MPAAQLADTVGIPAITDDGEVGLFLLPTDAHGVEVRPASTTNHEPHADVFLDGAVVSVDNRLGNPGDGGQLIGSLYTRALVGLCAIQVGVSERALRLAAGYTTGREQFGRPVGSFQAVQQRMADAFIDVEAIRWTTWHAAWLVAQGRPADRAARIAKLGPPRPVLELPPPHNTFTAGSALTPLIPCTATSCGPSTTSSPSAPPPHSWPLSAAHTAEEESDYDRQSPHHHLKWADIEARRTR